MATITKGGGGMPSPRESVSGTSVIAMGLQKKTQGGTERAVCYFSDLGKSQS